MPQVRLIRKDGGLLYLDATSFSISVSRSIPVIPIPVLAERMGIDTNSVQTDIQLDVVLRDDDCGSTQFQSKAAKASIDFGANATSTDGVTSQWFGGSVASASALNGKSFDISSLFISQSRVRKPIRVTFDSSTASHTSTGLSNEPKTTVGISGVTTPAGLASAVKTALEAANYSPTQVATDGGTQFTDIFTISAGEGKITTLGNSKLTFTQVELGGNGNNDSPIFWTDADANETVKPLHEFFRGGTAHNCRSAGDKLQDLIGYVGNASLMGAVGSTLSDTIEIDAGLAADVGDFGNDYIVGLQLPYNSLIQKTAVNADEQHYVTRNLLIVSGIASVDEQSSVGNNFPSGVAFDVTDKFTGIRGTVVGMNMGYDAGNNIYEGSITFQPLDLITGL
jgi:hypothetical protein